MYLLASWNPDFNCPHCGVGYSEHLGIGEDPSEEIVLGCHACGQSFTVARREIITYATTPEEAK